MLIFISIASESAVHSFFFNAPLAVFLGSFLYVFVLSLIYSQNKKLRQFAVRYKSKMLILANFQLLFFFIGYYFVFGIDHLILESNFIFVKTISIMFALLLYIIGLAVFEFVQNELKFGQNQAFSKTILQLGFLIPFLVPFILYLFFSDLSEVVSWNMIFSLMGITLNIFEERVISIIFGGVFVLSLLILMPKLVVLCWGCKDLEESELKNRLLKLCQQAKFKCAGLKTWGAMQDSLTAAIIGVWGRFRYVMFTPALLRRLSPNAVEAILAHEIGHSKCKHLLLYPLIIFGIFFIGSIVSFQIYTLSFSYIDEISYISNDVKNILELLVLFVILTLSLAILFRLVFGYFSRLFERQADLYIFKLGIPAAHLIGAFEGIAVGLGNAHNVPNWHHYSLQQRIDFLKNVENNPSLISLHHRKVTFSLLTYLISLAIILYLIY